MRMTNFLNSFVASPYKNGKKMIIVWLTFANSVTEIICLKKWDLMEYILKIEVTFLPGLGLLSRRISRLTSKCNKIKCLYNYQ